MNCGASVKELRSGWCYIGSITAICTIYCMFAMHNKENLRVIQIHAAAVRVSAQPYLSPGCALLIFPAYARLSLPHVEPVLSSVVACLCPHSALTRVEGGLIQFSVSSSKSWTSLRTRSNTHKCMLPENWLSLGLDNGGDWSSHSSQNVGNWRNQKWWIPANRENPWKSCQMLCWITC